VTDHVVTLMPPPVLQVGSRTTPDARPRISVRKLDALFGTNRAVRDVSIDFPDRQVTAINSTTDQVGFRIVLPSFGVHAEW